MFDTREYEFNTLPRSRFDIILNRPIKAEEYWSHVGAPIDHCESLINISFQEMMDFMNSVVTGTIRKRIFETLKHERVRHYMDEYWAERDEYRTEYGVREHTENFVFSVANICLENLKDDGKVLICIESCGLFSTDESKADIIIKVVK
jgi:hypothetical protein